jgi:hypothetical protein
MAADPDAQELTVNYTGGSLTMNIGLFKSLFGVDSPYLRPIADPKTVGVKKHSRTRVIGGPSTSVEAFTYTYDQWPTSQASNAAAGDVVLMQWDGSDGEWTGRVTGSLADLGSWLNSASLKVVGFKSQRGTKYGPFKAII